MPTPRGNVPAPSQNVPSGGNVPPTAPTPPLSPYLWYDAQNINLLANVGINDGDPIGTWKNAGSAGVAGDLVQATALNKPTFKKIASAGKLNNLSSAGFSGAKFVTVAAGLTLNQRDLVAIIVRTNNLGNVVVCQSDPGSAQQLFLNSVGPFWHLYAGTDQDTSIVPTANVYHPLLIDWNGASTVFRADKAAGVVGNPGALNGTGFTLGATSAGTSGITGEIVECLVYSGTLPAVTDVEAYFDAKYGAGWPQ